MMLPMSESALHVSSPVWRDPALEAGAQRELWFKMECFQPSGSFKLRGVGLLAQESKAAGRERLISSSGGNAGYAVCHAGRALGMPVVVVVPSSTPPSMMSRLPRK